MRVTSVELHPAGAGAAAIMSFRDPGRLTPYNVKSIEGLDADGIVPRYYGGSGSMKFYSLSLEKRDVVFQISLNPRPGEDETYSGLRDDLYKLIASSRTGLVEIQFKNGTAVTATVSGFVTKLGAPLFEKEPVVTITVSCPEPMLKAPDMVDVSLVGIDPSEFSITDAISTSPYGFKFVASYSDVAPSFRIFNPDDLTWEFEVIPAGGFLTGDVLHFSSEVNDKYLYLTRSAVDIHLGDVIQSGSVWPIMFPGLNTFSIEDYDDFTFSSITYYPTYWGV